MRPRRSNWDRPNSFVDEAPQDLDGPQEADGVHPRRLRIVEADHSPPEGPPIHHLEELLAVDVLSVAVDVL